MALNIFSQLIGDQCDLKEIDKDKNNHCNPLKRISAILNIYHKLDVASNKLHQNMFIQLMTTMYTSFLDDFNHLLIKHKQHLQSIHESMTDEHGMCDLKKCKFTSRHFDNNKTKVSDDNTFNFYKDTVDSLHFYVFHLYDVGMRIKDNEYKDDGENIDNTPDSDESIKYEIYFKRVRRMISDREQIGLEFDRFTSNQSKFNIGGNKEVYSESDSNASVTFVDSLLKLIEDRVYAIDTIYIPTKIMKKFRIYLFTEEYDTEAILLDVNPNESGNLKKAADDSNLYNVVANMVEQAKVRSKFFSIGYRFYYWDYYKSHKEYKDSYVAPKYSTFKEEISNYRASDFDMDLYEKCLIPKIQYYMKTKHARTIWKNIPDYDGEHKDAIELHYDIDDSNPRITFNHLLSLSLYTDYSNLCTEFSKSFRALSPYETTELVKSRNSKFYWMSRYLRETVQIFGDDGIPDHHGEINLQGPFYTGLSVKLRLPGTGITLCSPTSTSTEMSIAQRFAGNHGLLITLNNNIEHNQYLHGFSCSWISNYPEESEILFCGGHYNIRVVSIIQMETLHWVGTDLQRIDSPAEKRRKGDTGNTKSEISDLEAVRRMRKLRKNPTLTPFLELIQGMDRWAELTKEQWDDVMLWMSWKLGIQNVIKEPNQDYNLFLECLYNKTDLYLMPPDKQKMYKYDKRFMELMYEDDLITDGSPRYWDPVGNTFSSLLQEIVDPQITKGMFKSALLDLFDNLESLRILAQTHISLARLLSVIVDRTHIKRIQIRNATGSKKEMTWECDWIRALWSHNILRRRVIELYNFGGFTISHDTEESQSNTDSISCLLIKRIL